MGRETQIEFDGSGRENQIRPEIAKLEEVLSRINDLEKLYIEYQEIRGKPYDEIERKADILRTVPKELQQRLQLDIDDWDGVEVAVVLAKVNHYIRSMTTGRVAMDLSSISDRTVDDKNMGSFEESSEEQQQQQLEDATHHTVDEHERSSQDKGSHVRIWDAIV